MVNVIRVASAKSRSMSGAYHQSAFMGGCLTFGHMCFPCLPGGITLLF